MADQICAANGCNFLGRDWAVSKGDRTEILSRCERHAAQLRGNGFTVKAPENAKRDWDMSSTHSLESAASWFLGKSGALAVVVVRASDAVLALADGVTEQDVPKLLHAGLPGAYALLEQKQKSATEKKVRQQICDGVNPKERRYA